MDVSHWCSKVVEEAQGADAKVLSQPNVPISSIYPNYNYQNVQNTQYQQAYSDYYKMYPTYPTHANSNTNTNQVAAAQSVSQTQAYTHYYPSGHHMTASASAPITYAAIASGSGIQMGTSGSGSNSSTGTDVPTLSSNMGRSGNSSVMDMGRSYVPPKVQPAQYSSYAEYVAAKTMKNNTNTHTNPPPPPPILAPPPPPPTVLNNFNNSVNSGSSKREKRSGSRFSTVPTLTAVNTNTSTSISTAAPTNPNPNPNPITTPDIIGGNGVSLSKRKQKRIDAAIRCGKLGTGTGVDMNSNASSSSCSMDTNMDIGLRLTSKKGDKKNKAALNPKSNMNAINNTDTKLSSNQICSPTAVSREEIENRKKRMARFEQERIDNLQQYQDGIGAGIGAGIGHKSGKKARLEQTNIGSGMFSTITSATGTGIGIGIGIGIPTSTSTTLSETDIESLIVVGTCNRIEKDYFRLTSAPDPNTVRPLLILEKALCSLQARWNTCMLLNKNKYVSAFKHCCPLYNANANSIRDAMVQPQTGNASHMSEIDLTSNTACNSDLNIGTDTGIDTDIDTGIEIDYAYMCSQLKAIRLDLTVQHIKNEFTVAVYEFHGRVALICHDLNEYNQCQTQLKQLYSSLKGQNQNQNRSQLLLQDNVNAALGLGLGLETENTLKTKSKTVGVGISKSKQKKNKLHNAHTTNTTTSVSTSTSTAIPKEVEDLTSTGQNQHQHQMHESEFVAYRILYYIYLQYNKTSALGSSDLTHIISNLTDHLKRQPCIQHALAVQQALSGNNPVFQYHHFFRKLYRQTPNLGICIIDQIIDSLRIQVLLRIFKSIKPNLSVSTVLCGIGYEHVINEYRIYYQQHIEQASTTGTGTGTTGNVSAGISITKKKKKMKPLVNIEQEKPGGKTDSIILSILEGFNFLQSAQVKLVVDTDIDIVKTSNSNTNTNSKIQDFYIDPILMNIIDNHIDKPISISILKSINQLLELNIDTKETVINSTFLYKEKLL